MSARRTTTRLGAAAATLTVLALSASPASAHVTGTPSETGAGAFTILTMSVPHGCEGSPTTKIEVQIPESVLSVTPTRNAFYDVEPVIEQLDEPVTDAHGNEVTERTASVLYTATTPLPDGQRDTMELSFQVPDAVGEVLVFPTIQTCEQGRTGWVEVPEDGQAADELEHPAPAFEILPAAEGEGHGHGDDAGEEAEESAATSDAAATDDTQEASATSGSDALGWGGLVAGLLGLGAGVTALVRSRRRA